MVFSETRVNTDPLERPQTEDTPPTGPTSERLSLILQPSPPQPFYYYFHKIVISILLQMDRAKDFVREHCTLPKVVPQEKKKKKLY